MKYQTKQRDKIEQALFSRPEEHFTAEQLLALLEPRAFPGHALSHAAKLLAEGRIRKYEAGEGVGACYQSAIAPACAKTLSSKMQRLRAAFSYGMRDGARIGRTY